MFNTYIAIKDEGICINQEVLCENCELGNFIYNEKLKDRLDDLCGTDIVYFCAKLINSFTSLQKWKGYVTSFNEEIIFAQLTNLTNTSSAEFAEIPVEEISNEDKDLLSIGAVFYWNIGYYDNETGQRTRVSVIRFQRLPKWTKKELHEAEIEAEEIEKYFENR